MPIYRVVLVLGVAVLSTLTAPVLAQEWPTKPVRMVVPFAAGGSVDATARLLANELRNHLGQQVFVENRAGAGGTIGAAAVATAPADGYTLLWANSAVMTAAPVLMPKLPYDPSRDFRPISLAMRTWHVVLGSPKHPYRNLSELLAAAQAAPGKLDFGSGGSGSAVHIVAERILSDTKTSMLHVPYRGSAQALVDLTSGRIHMLIETLASGMQSARNGNARALAISAPSRLASAPDVPTIAESGVPGFVTNAWFGIVAPAALPDAVASKLEASVRAALASPEIRTRLEELGVEPIGAPPDEFARFMVGETAATRRVVQAAGIKLQ